MSEQRDATGERSRLLLALDRMIESVQEDINLEDVGNYATISALVGEKKGLSTARELAERCALSEIPRKTDQEPCAWRYKEHTEQVGWRYSEKSPTEPWAIEIEPLYSLPWWAPFVPSAIAPSTAPDEDGERYRWFRDECDQDRRIVISELAGEFPEMLDHHIDKGRCGL